MFGNARSSGSKHAACCGLVLVLVPPAFALPVALDRVDGAAADLAAVPGSAPLRAVEAPATPAGEDGEEPRTLPRLLREHVVYLGSFAVPIEDGAGNPLTYGGHALGHRPGVNSLFFGCHDWFQLLAEVSIPPVGGTATVLQDCTDVTEGTLSEVDPGDPNGIRLGGHLVHAGRLITSAFAYYDADGTQVVTHGVSSSPDLSQSGDFDGWYGFTGAVAFPRALAGYMTPIPAEWQPLFGGPAFTGQGSLSIVGNSSDGPSATVFDPADVGGGGAIPGTTVVFYPIAHSHPDFEAKGSQLAGMAFPRGTRTVLFFGTRAQCEYCYGLPQDCPCSCSPYHGPHNHYRHAIWAYDADHLLRVKNGELEPWEVMPYATWELADIHAGDCASTRYGGATFDPEAGVLYVVEDYGENPAVHAFRIDVHGVPGLDPFFVDGFESGDTSAWSSQSP